MRLRRGRSEENEGDATPDAYLALAREIHEDVARIASDPTAHGDLLEEALDRVPRNERERLAQRIFEALDADTQWAVIERVFGDVEIRKHLQGAREGRHADLARAARHRELAARARAAGALDTRDALEGDRLVLGLFSARDVRAAIGRGHHSTAAARQLVVRSRGGGDLQVLEDVFNPHGGHFVTGAYTEQVWQQTERLASHAIVRVGAISDAGFEPVLYPGGRVDVCVGDRLVTGQLHLGFAMVGHEDVFVP